MLKHFWLQSWQNFSVKILKFNSTGFITHSLVSYNSLLIYILIAQPQNWLNGASFVCLYKYFYTFIMPYKK